MGWLAVKAFRQMPILAAGGSGAPVLIHRVTAQVFGTASAGGGIAAPRKEAWWSRIKIPIP